MADPETRPMPASLAMVASALFFSLMGVCVKQVGTRIPATEVVLARAVVSVVLSWWMLRRAGIAPWGQRRGLLIWRGAIGTLALLCVYQALALLPLAAATVLQYSYPTFTALLAWLSLGEPVGPRLLGAVALGWMGVMVLAWPPAGAELGTSLPPLAVAIALVGAFSTALAYVSVRALRHSEHPLVIVFYFPLVALVLSLPLVLMNPVVPSWGELVWLLGVGLFTQLGQLTLTAGLMGLPAARATAISYVQVAFAVLWGWLIFAEPLEATTLVGGLLVLAAALISLKRAGSMAGGSA
jgi:drug/metabolite transporter (DMT)-like permease